MSNLIKNEITKIFKKKAIYITFIITVLFILLANLLCKYADKFGEGSYNDSYKQYLQTQISKLDYTKSSDNTEYISVKTNLDLIELQEKYGMHSWQSNILQEKIYPIINSYNTYKYALEKEEESLKIAEDEYNKYIKLLDSGDWRYFAKEDLKQVEEEIKKLQESKNAIEDRVELASIDSRIYDYNLQKQILNWRLEKDISYNTKEGRVLDRYYNYQSNVYAYEKDKSEKKYEDELQYKSTLAIAEKYKYAIEHDIKLSEGNDFKGILEDFFSNFELFIIIMIVMIAGSIVSEEFNKGTIKLLLVKPYSRIKILLSKFITSIVMIAIVILAILIMQTLIGGLVFGFEDLSIPTIQYNFNTNSVVEMNTLAYVGITLLHKLPLYILIITIAFTLSTVFTNTPLAIVISLLGYMSTSIINVLVKEFNVKFMKFFITPNWDFTQYLFGALPEFEHVNFNFSAFICILYFMILIIPTFIIFKKKNIKNV